MIDASREIIAANASDVFWDPMAEPVDAYAITASQEVAAISKPSRLK